MDQVYVCIYVVRAGHILKLLTHRQRLQRIRMLHVFSAISRSNRKCVQQLDSALWCPWVGHVTIKSGNYTFKGNLSCCWRFISCQGIVKTISASPQTAEVSRQDHSHLTRKRFLFSQSWNFRLQASISWRFITHSYSPYFESNVPFCRDRSLRVKRGPSSWIPTFFSFLKMYLWNLKKTKSRWLWKVATCLPTKCGSCGKRAANRRPMVCPKRVVKLLRITSG